MSSNNSPVYRIYLVTIWQAQSENDIDVPRWRFRLEDPKTGRHQLFVDQQTLIEHLVQWAMHIAPDDTTGS